MVVILLIAVVIMIAGVATSLRLSPGRVRRRRESTESFTASERVTTLPIRRPRISETASRIRQISQISTPANVKVLADYRKTRTNRLRSTRIAGVPRSTRPRRPEPA